MYLSGSLPSFLSSFLLLCPLASRGLGASSCPDVYGSPRGPGLPKVAHHKLTGHVLYLTRAQIPWVSQYLNSRTFAGRDRKQLEPQRLCPKEPPPASLGHPSIHPSIPPSLGPTATPLHPRSSSPKSSENRHVATANFFAPTPFARLMYHGAQPSLSTVHLSTGDTFRSRLRGSPQKEQQTSKAHLVVTTGQVRSGRTNNHCPQAQQMMSSGKTSSRTHTLRAAGQDGPS